MDRGGRGSKEEGEEEKKEGERRKGGGEKKTKERDMEKERSPGY